MLPTAVLVGGLGTRVRHLTGDEVPKALLRVAGRPFIDHKLEELHRAGVTHVVLLVGHGADQLVAHVRDGSEYGVHVRYSCDGPTPRGTAGAVYGALPLLGPAFFLTYGDTLLDVPVASVADALRSTACSGVMTVLENADRWETSNVDVALRRVVAYEKLAPPGRHRFLDYGFLAFKAEAFEAVAGRESVDLSVVIESLVARNELLAFRVRSRFHDVGTEAALRETEAWLADGKP
jgi:NDP-sugar pyrophosphorylase family protein